MPILAWAFIGFRKTTSLDGQRFLVALSFAVWAAQKALRLLVVG